MEGYFMAKLAGHQSYTETDTGVDVLADLTVGGQDKQISISVESEDRRVVFSDYARSAVEELINGVFYSPQSILNTLNHYPDTYNEIQSHFFDKMMDIFLKGNDNDMLEKIYLLVNNIAKYLWFSSKSFVEVNATNNKEVDRYIRQFYMESELIMNPNQLLHDPTLSKYLSVRVCYLSSTTFDSIINIFLQHGLIKGSPRPTRAIFFKVHSSIGTFIFVNRSTDSDDCYVNVMGMQELSNHSNHTSISDAELELVIKLLYKSS
jgi:hypothetical protein